MTIMRVIQWLISKQLHCLHVFLLTAGLIVFSVTPLLADRNLSYNPETVNLVGILHRVVVPGPPNYENITTGDQPETVWFVALHEQVTAQSNDNDSSHIGESAVEGIQLLLPENRYNHLLNQKVVASGTLFDAHTVHHHTPVLMFVTKVQTY
jgi:Fe-S-cluster formation regulator IscX/YfhJ